MKSIFLIGDSIRMGYDAYVNESMQNVAKVFYPDSNCMYAEHVLRNLHEWKMQFGVENADAVHFNAGLWDTLRIYGDDPITKIDVYADYIERIIKRIKFLFPEAKIIFATSTPCIEDEFIKDFEYRTNADVEKYNKIATEIVLKHGGIINDLYDLLKDKQHLHSDQTHYYTAEGTRVIGEQVNNVLCDALDIDRKDLILPDSSKYEQVTGKNDKEIYVKRGRFYEKVLGI